MITDHAAWAVDTVVRISASSRQSFRKNSFRTRFKDDGSPVTEVDQAIERSLRSAISSAHPADGILGEEYGEKMGTSSVRWVIDPIDGTKQFVRGVPQFATLLAREVDGQADLGIIHMPVLDITVVAERGRGCWRNGSRVHVSGQRTLKGSFVLANWLENWPLGAVDELTGQGAIVRTWGDAFGYALVACGLAESVIDHDAKIYDLAAMPVIIQEAGGRFTSLSGEDSYTKGTGIGSNGKIHELVRAVM